MPRRTFVVTVNGVELKRTSQSRTYTHVIVALETVASAEHLAQWRRKRLADSWDYWERQGRPEKVESEAAAVEQAETRVRELKANPGCRRVFSGEWCGSAELACKALAQVQRENPGKELHIVPVGASVSL